MEHMELLAKKHKMEEKMWTEIMKMRKCEIEQKLRSAGYLESRAVKMEVKK